MPHTTTKPAIWYETTGDASHPALLLVNGLGSQMTLWPPDLVTMLADRGLFVIAYDNRDVGLSDGFDDATYDFGAGVNSLRNGEPVDAPYSLADMASDGMAVLDALGVERAHVAGVSMGGMIVQTMASHFPERLHSMTSIMSYTGRRDVGRATPEANAVLMQSPPKSREEAIEQGIESARVIGSPEFFDADLAAAGAALAYDRAFRPAGIARQLLAVWNDGDRTDRLASVTTPTLVIHGTADPLITPDGGEQTAEAIPGARLELIDGMGHDYPPQLVPTLVDLLASHAVSS